MQQGSGMTKIHLFRIDPLPWTLNYLSVAGGLSVPGVTRAAAAVGAAAAPVVRFLEAQCTRQVAPDAVDRCRRWPRRRRARLRRRRRFRGRRFRDRRLGARRAACPCGDRPAVVGGARGAPAADVPRIGGLEGQLHIVEVLLHRRRGGGVKVLDGRLLPERLLHGVQRAEARRRPRQAQKGGWKKGDGSCLLNIVNQKPADFVWFTPPFLPLLTACWRPLAWAPPSRASRPEGN